MKLNWYYIFVYAYMYEISTLSYIYTCTYCAWKMCVYICNLRPRYIETKDDQENPTKDLFLLQDFFFFLFFFLCFEWSNFFFFFPTQKNAYIVSWLMTMCAISWHWYCHSNFVLKKISFVIYIKKKKNLFLFFSLKKKFFCKE